MRANLPSNLKDGKGCSNPSLSLDKYLGDIDSVKNDLLKNIADTKCSQRYQLAFEKWLKNMQSDPHVILLKCKVKDRLVVGLSGDNPLEISFTLNKPYGVPYIPGASIKGLARHYLNHINMDNNKKKTHNDIIFGMTDESGFVTFYDAWYIPEGDNKPLRLDVMAVHHQSYNNDHITAPSDFDEPIPIYFLSAVGSYLVALKCEDDDWKEFSGTLVEKALREWGAGGKTSSGYGRMSVTKYGQVNISDTSATNHSSMPQQPEIDPIAVSISKIPVKDVKNQINSHLAKWKEKPDGSKEKLEIAKAYYNKLVEAGIDKEKKWITKDNVAEILAYYESH